VGRVTSNCPRDLSIIFIQDEKKIENWQSYRKKGFQRKKRCARIVYMGTDNPRKFCMCVKARVIHSPAWGMGYCLVTV